MHEETLEGVSLKHVLDNMYSCNKYQQVDGLSRSSIFFERLAACDNHNINKISGGAPFPQSWTDWSIKYNISDVPLVHEMTLEMTFRPEDAAHWEPSSIDNVLDYKIYLISNEEVIIHCVSNSKNLIADRIQTEMRFILTQRGDSVENVRTHIEARGRTIIKKAVGPLKSLVLKKASDSMKKGTKKLWQGV